MADVSCGQQAGPGPGGLQFADLVVAGHGGQVWRSHCGHEQGPVVGLQGRGRV